MLAWHRGKKHLKSRSKIYKISLNFRTTIYSHVTTATDLDNVKCVFDAVRDIIVIQYVRELANV